MVNIRQTKCLAQSKTTHADLSFGYAFNTWHHDEIPVHNWRDGHKHKANQLSEELRHTTCEMVKGSQKLMVQLKQITAALLLTLKLRQFYKPDPLICPWFLFWRCKTWARPDYIWESDCGSLRERVLICKKVNDRISKTPR